MEEFHMPLKENFQELVQHGKAGFPIQYYVNSLHIPGNNVPMHWHPNLEFFVVHCGRVRIHAGNNIITLEKGQGIFLNANCLHSYENQAEEGPCYCPNVVFQPEFIAPVNSVINMQYVMPLTLNSQLPYVLLDGTTDWSRSVLSRLDRVFSMLQAYGEIGRYGETPVLDFTSAPGERECFEIRVLCEISLAWAELYAEDDRVYPGALRRRRFPPGHREFRQHKPQRGVAVLPELSAHLPGELPAEIPGGALHAAAARQQHDRGSRRPGVRIQQFRVFLQAVPDAHRHDPEAVPQHINRRKIPYRTIEDTACRKVDTEENLKETVGENSCFPPHPFSALLSLGISPSADGDEGAALDSPAF